MSNEGEAALTRRALRELRRAQEARALEAEHASDSVDAAAEPAQPEANEAATGEKSPESRVGSVSPSATSSDEASTAVTQPGRGKRAAATADVATEPAEESTPAERVQRANRSRRAAEGPVDAVPERPERSSLQRARDREALRRRRAAEAADVQAPAAAGDEAAPLTRRQLRLQALAAAKAAAGREPTPAGSLPVVAEQAEAAATPEAAAEMDTAPNSVAPSKSTGETRGKVAASPAAASEDAPRDTKQPVAEMSVEDALRARQEASAATDVPGAAADQSSSSAGPAPTDDTGLVDLETLASQRERAARAAIINRRIAERRRLEAENAQRANASSPDPFTGAMNQFIGPEAEKRLANTGVTGPQTSGVQIELPSAGGVRRPGSGAAQSSAGSADSADAGAPAAIAASKAQGLDPLDQVTAGIRRANQWFYVSFGALGVGVATFVAGLIMIINSN